MNPNIKKSKLVCLLIIMISLFAIIYELIITLNYLENLNIFTFLFWHLLLVIILFFMCLVFYRLKFKTNILLIITVEVAFLGIFGAFIAIIALLLSFKQSSYVEEFLPELKKEMLDKKELAYTHVLHSSNLIEKEIFTEPLEDVMNYGSVGEQITALIRMNRYFKPEFTKFILNGLNSRENTIRVQSAAIITDIEQKTVIDLNKILLISEYEKKIEMLLTFYEKFLNTGFINYGRIGSITKKKLVIFSDYFKTLERDLRSKIIYAQLLYEFNEIDNAKTILNSSIFSSTEFLSIQETLKTVLLSMLYNMGKYEYVREISKFLAENSCNKGNEISDCFAFWSYGAIR